MGKLFGTDGIRGEANRYPMNAAIAFGVGQAVAHLFKKDKHRAHVIIGKDTRISGIHAGEFTGSGNHVHGRRSLSLSACCPPRGLPSLPKACGLTPALSFPLHTIPFRITA